MKKLRIISLLFILFFIAFLCLKKEVVIEIKNDENQLSFMSKTYAGEKIEYAYLHSVSLTPIQETLEINDELIFITTKVKYLDQGGAGMPELAYGDSVFYIEDHYFVIDHMDRRSEELNIHVKLEYQNSMKINKQKLFLYEMCNDNKGVVSVKIVKISLIHYYLNKLRLSINPQNVTM